MRQIFQKILNSQAPGVRQVATALRFFGFCHEILRGIISPGVNARLLLGQMEYIGVRSVGIIVLAAIMIGAVFGIQFGMIFRLFGAESMVGAAASFALSKELAPVISSFLVTGRSGSAMAAELGTMRVNEQIDAMRVMAVDPILYLASPRVMASMIMMPLLSALFLFCGVASTYYIGVRIFEVDAGLFMKNIEWISKPRHIFEGLEKAVMFGAIFSTIGCYSGFYASGGAEGVGRSTTRAVVISLVTILISDFFISYFQYRALKG